MTGPKEDCFIMTLPYLLYFANISKPESILTAAF